MSDHLSRKMRRLTAATALAVALAGAPFQAQARDTAPRPPDSRSEIALSFAPVVRAAAPAVVSISARQVVDRPSPFAGDPFFERFFGQILPQGPQLREALGSGVILSPDGLVVSNHHVVGAARDIRVTLADGRAFDGDLLLSDPEGDLAILRLRGASDLPALELRPSDGLEVGDLVLAIGNPFGVGQTVTSGIVSALARTNRAGGYYIQTDAAINPGNSGGALVDMQGRLVGVPTAILSRSGGSHGIGFAVPADLVAQALAQARQGAERLARPWAGLTGQPVDAALAEALGLPAPQGLVVADLHPDSPFAGAGVRRGDVLTALDGRPVGSAAELSFRLAAAGLGAEVRADWRAEGRERHARLRLTAAPETPPRDERRLGGPSLLAGLHVANLNPALAEDLGASPLATGVVVLGAEGRATRSGLRPGDVIEALNGAPVSDAAALARAAERVGRDLRLTVRRDGRRGDIRLRG